jgi:hypothetical protein
MKLPSWLFDAEIFFASNLCFSWGIKFQLFILFFFETWTVKRNFISTFHSLGNFKGFTRMFLTCSQRLYFKTCAKMCQKGMLSNWQMNWYEISYMKHVWVANFFSKIACLHIIIFFIYARECWQISWIYKMTLLKKLLCEITWLNEWVQNWYCHAFHDIGEIFLKWIFLSLLLLISHKYEDMWYRKKFNLIFLLLKFLICMHVLITIIDYCCW